MAHLAMAALQLELQPGDNLDLIEREIRLAKRRFAWVDLIVLGELNAFGVDKAFAQPMPGPAENRMAALAAELGVWLVPGSFYERAEDGRIYNTMPVIDPQGRVVARYRKIYPFYPYEAGVAAGDRCVVFDIPGVARLGLSNCYDMWFPETTRTLAAMGAEVILHPGLTNTIDRDVEFSIARASAAVNQLYFVDLNGAAPLAFGRSGVFGPGGEVIYSAGAGREFIALDLDLSQVQRVRERGWNGLGQTLKSFRDGPRHLRAYAEQQASPSALDALGPLEMPASATRRPAGQEAGEPDDHQLDGRNSSNDIKGGLHHA